MIIPGNPPSIAIKFLSTLWFTASVAVIKLLKIDIESKVSDVLKSRFASFSLSAIFAKISLVNLSLVITNVLWVNLKNKARQSISRPERKVHKQILKELFSGTQLT